MHAERRAQAKHDKEMRIANQLAEAKYNGHKSAVAQLQTYVLGNTFIRIYDLDGTTPSASSSDDEKVRLAHWAACTTTSLCHALHTQTAFAQWPHKL